MTSQQPPERRPADRPGEVPGPGGGPAFGPGPFGGGQHPGYGADPFARGADSGYGADAGYDTDPFGPTYPPPGPPRPAGQGYPPPGPRPEPNRPKGAGRRTIAIAALVAALVGGGVGAGTAALVSDANGGTSASGLSFSSQSAAPAAKIDGTIAAAAAKISPSVVTIYVSSAREQDTGSGVIIRPDGYILTNNHVVSNATSNGGAIRVVLSDGRAATATVVGTDPSDDLAVIKVKLTGLNAASFASSGKLVVGQTVVAVGAPLGLSDTVTAGIVSNTARPVTTSDDQNDQAVFNAVQTDAAINPGNSGGPLVNLNGDVVGINAAIATDQSQGGLLLPGQQSQPGNIGIGFAIPSDEASRIAAELIKTGKATHAVMGVTVQTSQNSATRGAVIKKVNADSPAAEAGLKAGDVVVQADKQRIDDATALVAAIRSHAPGEDVKIEYVRGGDHHTVTMTLGTSSD